MITISKESIRRLAKKWLRRTELPRPTPAPRIWREWSIGIYRGSSPFCFMATQVPDQPVLTRQNVTDVPALFVADPFMIRANGRWWMFFEVWNGSTKKGDIALANSEDGLAWKYEQVVLTEPFHLSYPYVFQWGNDWFMVPETCQVKSVRLYKATQFPTQWTFVKSLLDGKRYVDPCPFYFQGRWWMFAGLGLPPYEANDLHLFHAKELTGPWKEHWKSPVVRDNVRIARPSGRVVTLRERAVRYAQDCDGGYGLRVRAFEIAKLTRWRYQEREAESSPVLAASGTGWNASGMHHIDPHCLQDGTWIACVDGQIATTF